MKKSGLTPKQEAFVAYYLVEPNGTKAAIQAGYSLRTAAAMGSENLTKPNVADVLVQARQLRAERVQIEADDVLRQVARMAFVDPRKFVDEQSQPTPLHLIPDDVAAAIQAVEITEHAGSRILRVLSAVLRL